MGPTTFTLPTVRCATPSRVIRHDPFHRQVGVVDRHRRLVRHPLPASRRSRKTPIALARDVVRDRLLLSISFTGLFIVPVTYVTIDEPAFANYPLHPVPAGPARRCSRCRSSSFYRTHRDLGRSWSVTLEIRETHQLVTAGVYRYVRHPMYSAFFMWAIAQALLLPNWIAGVAGLVGFGTLFALRIGSEERMMAATFGEEYVAYAARTRRVVPGVF